MSPLELGGALGALAAVWCAAVGGAVGSFLNVVIARVPVGESIVHPGSRCPRCKAHIRWYDNLPIASWLILRARCRGCGVRISARYPAVEVLGIAIALLAFARHGLSGAAAAELGYAAALLALAFIDLDTWLLPNAITWPLIGFAVAMGALGASPAGSLRVALYGAGIGFAAFGGLWLFGEKVLKKEALGFGDVWLLAALGGWEGPQGILPIVLLASIQGSIIGGILIALGKGEPGREGRATGPASPDAPSPRPSPPLRGGEGEMGTSTGEVVSPGLTDEDDWVPPRHAVPFGPFLVAGALEWLYLGDLLARAVPTLAFFR
jgi:leader peptidase (prepilin peptidase) / N-methyltransferase